MKILKIFGAVVGLHVLTVILIFAIPGCSSTSKPAPVPSDTIARSDTSPPVSVPGLNPSANMSASAASTPSAPPVTFNPDAPATAAPSSGGVRFTPTRPNTPVASTLIAEPVQDVTPAKTYVVANGDSLYVIAKREHTSVAEIAATNNLKTNAVLHAGQKLIIPGKPASATAAATANPAAAQGKTAETIAPKPNPANANAAKHVVKSGETLSSIAKQYGVTQSELGTVNNITDPKKIRPGMELVIPGWQTPASKSGKASRTSERKSAAPAEAPPPDAVTPKSAPNEVPVIKIDESPVTPVPPPTK